MSPAITECALCGHFTSEHARAIPGRPRRCEVRFGTFSDPPTLGELCSCPGYEPHSSDELARWQPDWRTNV